jgi:ElaB/YqjD/DUF883 family membrane-anchored ribosome-binding protein
MLETLYKRGVSLLRDIFQYLIPATYFICLFSVLFWDEIKVQLPDLLLRYGLWFGALYIVTCYIVGQLLYILSTLIIQLFERVFKKLFNNSSEEYKEFRNKIEKVLMEINQRVDAKKDPFINLPPHLYFETKVLAKSADLHAFFIERYNNMLFFMRCLVSASFILGIVFLIFSCFNSVRGFGFPNYVSAIIFFVMSLLFYREFLSRRIGFLERTYASYFVANGLDEIGRQREIKNKYVWYASYGSNLSRDRFLCYIRGGRPANSSKEETGCRDSSLPILDGPIAINFPLYFAKNAARWNNGGVCFLGLTKQTEHTTRGRMYLITQEQFIDVLRQENGDNSLNLDFESIIESGSKKISNGWYGNILFLGFQCDYPIFTFTSSEQYQYMKPDKTYLKTIINGLQEIYALPIEEAIDYLISKPGIQGNFTRDELKGELS